MCFVICYQASDLQVIDGFRFNLLVKGSASAFGAEHVTATAEQSDHDRPFG